MVLIPGAYAQQADTEAELLQKYWGQGKKALIERYMQFSDAESAAFWPVYDAYMEKRQALGNDRIKIIGDYARNYANLTDDKAAQLTQTLLTNDLKLTKLEKKYYNKFKKVLSPLRASQFMQMERYLHTSIRNELQEAIPFIGELDRMRQ